MHKPSAHISCQAPRNNHKPNVLTRNWVRIEITSHSSPGSRTAPNVGQLRPKPHSPNRLPCRTYSLSRGDGGSRNTMSARPLRPPPEPPSLASFRKIAATVAQLATPQSKLASFLRIRNSRLGQFVFSPGTTRPPHRDLCKPSTIMHNARPQIQRLCVVTRGQVFLNPVKTQRIISLSDHPVPDQESAPISRIESDRMLRNRHVGTDSPNQFQCRRILFL